MGNENPEALSPPRSEAGKPKVEIPERQPPFNGGEPKSERKDLAFMGIGLFLGFASLATSDPWLFFSCLILAWACFIYIAIAHSNFTYKTLFCVFGTMIFIIGAFRAYYYSQNQAQASQRETVGRFERLGGRIDNQKKEYHYQTITMSSKIDTLRSNLLAFQEEQQIIMMALATNSSYSPEFRERMIASHKKYLELHTEVDDLKTYMANLRGRDKDERALNQIQREQQINDKQSKYTQLFVCFEYAIQSFTNILTEEAALYDDKIDFTFYGLPPSVNPENNTPIPVADIKLQKNKGCTFQIVLLPFDPQLVINGHGSFGMNSTRGGGGVNVDGGTAHNFQFTLDSYKIQIDEAIGRLVLNQESILSNTNK
jgi:hypothetical protein